MPSLLCLLVPMGKKIRGQKEARQVLDLDCKRTVGSHANVTIAEFKTLRYGPTNTEGKNMKKVHMILHPQDMHIDAKNDSKRKFYILLIWFHSPCALMCMSDKLKPSQWLPEFFFLFHRTHEQKSHVSDEKRIRFASELSALEKEIHTARHRAREHLDRLAVQRMVPAESFCSYTKIITRCTEI